ncbi:hypothetical protein AX16_001626 [Volvariella volvacea WC 439]|nr:hypothetical protein AX16_001626 [Volvariella volvacea WC 439]
MAKASDVVHVEKSTRVLVGLVCGVRTCHTAAQMTPQSSKLRQAKDRGEGDLLSKAIVVLQTSWFVAQCIACDVQGLGITEIELVTLAFAALNGITYGLWWDKPLNVGYPIYFDQNGVRVDGPHETADGPGESNVESEEGKWERRWHPRMIWGYISCKAQKGVGGDKSHTQRWYQGIQNLKGSWTESVQKLGVKRTVWRKFIAPLWWAVSGTLVEMMREGGYDEKSASVPPFYSGGIYYQDRNHAALYGSIVGTVFGGIHLVGWNLQFPTLTECWLWRVSSLLLVFVPLILAVGLTLGFRWRSAGPIIESFTLVVGFPLYIVARTTILFLAFASLRALPDSAYQNVKWTEFLPHI